MIDFVVWLLCDNLSCELLVIDAMRFRTKLNLRGVLPGEKYGASDRRTRILIRTLDWRHNKRDGVSNHRRQNFLFKRLFRCKSKKTSKIRATGFVRGIQRWPLNSPHKGPLTGKLFPFDDVIMISSSIMISVFGFLYMFLAEHLKVNCNY